MGSLLLKKEPGIPGEKLQYTLGRRFTQDGFICTSRISDHLELSLQSKHLHLKFWVLHETDKYVSHYVGHM